MIFSRYSPEETGQRSALRPVRTVGLFRLRLTDAVSRLPADGRRALDVGPRGGHVVVPAQLRQQMLDQVDEDQVPARHHQVAQSHDGPLETGRKHAQEGFMAADLT